MDGSKSPRAVVLLLWACAAICLHAPVVWGQRDAALEPVRGFAGVSDRPWAATWWDPDGPGPLGEQLVVAGQFLAAGEVATTNFARWDGERWHAMDAMAGGVADLRRVAIRRLLVVDGTLYATVDSARDLGLFSWEGGLDGHWTAVPQAPDGKVLAIAEHHEHHGRLVVGGRFSVPDPAGGSVSVRAAAWNGEFWEPMGYLDGEVYALHADGVNLWAGGLFGIEPGGEDTNIARWDGERWVAVGDGLAQWSAVYALHTHEGVLFAGGENHASRGALARLEGGNWIEETLPDADRVYALATFEDRLVAGRGWDSLNRAPVIERVEGAWRPLAGVHGQTCWELLADENRLVVLGDDLERGADGSMPAGVLLHDGGSWHVLGQSGPARAGQLASTGDHLLVGGQRMGEAGLVNLFGRWDGQGLLPPVPGDRGRMALNTVHAMLVDGPTTYLGGRFSDPAGEISTCVVAVEDGQWRPLGDGLNNDVLDLVMWDGQLVASGLFSGSGQEDVYDIAVWDGQQWSQLGDTSRCDTVRNLAVYEGRLLATNCPGIAEWDPQLGQWKPFTGESLACFVRLDVLDGELYVTSCESDDWNIGRWNGVAFEPVGDGQPGDLQFRALASHERSLYAAGYTSSPYQAVLRRFDGDQWHSLDDRFDGGNGTRLFGLAVHDGGLYVGGDFDLVESPDGFRAASALARLGHVCRADLDGDGELTIFDFLEFQNLFDAGDLAADFDEDGELTLFDFLAFQNAFDAGCP